MIYGQPLTLGGGGGKNTIPDFTYTGNAALRTSADYDLYGDYPVLALETSGTLTFAKAFDADVFLVGGGGGGEAITTGYTTVVSGCGGGGGYTKTINIELAEAVCTIGAGGAAHANGGATTLTVGGEVVETANGGTSTGYGGSGGGKGQSTVSSISKGYDGGEDGGNGGGWTTQNGQGTTTRAFGERGAMLFAGGGGAGYRGVGGGGGGGTGAADSGSAGTAGSTNTGGGGGGNASYRYENPGAKAGGSGIILIRPHQDL